MGRWWSRSAGGTAAARDLSPSDAPAVFISEKRRLALAAYVDFKRLIEHAKKARIQRAP